MTGTRNTRPEGTTRRRSAALDALPPQDTDRWVARRKAEVVAAVHAGLLTLEEACQRYSLSVEEFLSWQRAFTAQGVRGLRVTKVREPRTDDPTP